MAAVRDLAKLAQTRVGQVLRKKWRIERLIDVGGMAAAYEATHRNGNRGAVKILHPFFAALDEARERFLNEGYAANKVGSPSRTIRASSIAISTGKHLSHEGG